MVLFYTTKVQAENEANMKKWKKMKNF